jgi:hypothetical protein
MEARKIGSILQGGWNTMHTTVQSQGRKPMAKVPADTLKAMLLAAVYHRAWLKAG